MIDLKGKRGLVVGVANEASIAAGCARAFRAAGAELALTFLNEKARPWVEPVAQEVGAPLFLPCDVREPGQLEGLCCTNPFWDSSHESSVVAGIHEQTHTSNLQDQELASLQ